MIVNGTSKITASHRLRTAAVYLRQSTLIQVRDNTESTLRQYALGDEAVRLGWDREDVLVIDADLGLSGKFGQVREGFRDLVAKVCLGEVGAIFGLEVSRLARSSADFARLLELARLTDVLLIDDDGVYDLTNFNDRLLLGLKGSMSEAELHILSSRLQGAKRAAAERGDLRSPLPVGYVYDDEGNCVIDPDMEVQAAIRDVFAAFAAGGSAYQVVAAFVDRRFPLRAYGGAWAGQLRWGKLTHARALGVLSNPCYAGTYVYGRNTTRRRVQPDGSVRTSLTRVPREQWPVVLHDHHEGYWTWADYVAAEAKLKANCTRDGARPAREGLALCQGIMFCGSCGRPMTTRYHSSGRAAYECSLSRADHEATATCRSIRADIVDDAVVAALLETLSPEHIELALAAADEVAGRHTRSHRAAELAVERAQYDADRAERTFTAVDPENRMVARTLEARWEARLAALDQAQAALNSAREAKPALPDRSALQALAADLPGLWHAPDTRDRDRKRLLRTLISDVTLLPETDRARARVGVRWHTGATDELALTRPRLSADIRRTPAAARELIATLRPDHSDEQVVAALAAAQLTTGTGRPYDVAAVKWVSYTYKIPAPVPFRDGEICVNQAAQILGITADAVYYWLTHGRLDARKDSGGRWCIPWNDQVEANCRRQIDTSGHLTPRPTTPPQTLPGEVSVQQGAAHLGVVEHALYYWIRCGRLTARKDVGGRWCIPWDDQVEADCRDWITHPEQFMPTGRRPLPAEAARADEISIPEAAARLGVLDAAVRYQVRIGRLPAHRTPSGRIAIPWNDQVEAALRADLDRPKHSGPTGPGSHPLPDTTTARGELSVQQVADRLGVRAGAVYYWIARHRLDAHRAADGRLSIPWTSDNEAAGLQLAAQTMKSDLTTRTPTAGGAV
ncbi:recombinase family protein [Streptomyces sp. NBC_01549]|uniref:recombinase family protein n=1 Tax=Streptomyces sp. NBC_01549 TaxID=2975874 RepID=UPI002259E733|nr:recombinase family protein [Streptomyces sp. NBC_01549]MCX4589256.1 recombinase family protein [Streptomyces sp. NBC_01549]MCX4593735.1 recombinase family protein [Streptomyces sp. NBC_01549]MCX4597398.1 recombinase family protein [Streptomyces sp. NBC_01549]MCX4598426.1 recombinase family protein [Streptomyces sp. NBC_01549]